MERERGVEKWERKGIRKRGYLPLSPRPSPRLPSVPQSSFTPAIGQLKVEHGAELCFASNICGGNRSLMMTVDRGNLFHYPYFGTSEESFFFIPTMTLNLYVPMSTYPNSIEI